MSVIGGQNQSIVSNGLVYAVDFANTRSYVSGSTIIKSLVLDNAITYASNIKPSTGSIEFDYPWTGFIQRTGSLFNFGEDSSFTIFMGINVTAESVENSGSLFIQNTDDYQLAAYVATSSIHIGFYYPKKQEYYVRSYAKPFSTTTQFIAYRYDRGTVDVFIDGLPVTSSRTNFSILSQVTSSAGSFLEFSDIPKSFIVGYGTPSGSIYGVGTVRSYLGNLTELFIYNRALTFQEIYQNYYYGRNSLSTVNNNLFPYSLDENTLLYVSASGISTNTNAVSAVDRFITSLKSANIWNKTLAIYPTIGNTTASRALNLKEPGINSIVYTGSWQTSSLGIVPSNSGSYLFLPYQYPSITTSSLHLSYMSYDTPVTTGSLISNKKPLRAIGGEVFYSSSMIYHVFRTTGMSSSFQVLDPSLSSVEVLVVGGGGAGSGFGGGGGGAGGLNYIPGHPVLPYTTYTVIVGAGGLCRANDEGNSGSYSAFDTIRVEGGGAGISMFGSPSGKSNGGSGGGAGREHGGAQSGLSGSGIPGQGNNGGPKAGLGNSGAAGGGGASQAGQCLLQDLAVHQVQAVLVLILHNMLV